MKRMGRKVRKQRKNAQFERKDKEKKTILCDNRENYLTRPRAKRTVGALDFGIRKQNCGPLERTKKLLKSRALV